MAISTHRFNTARMLLIAAGSLTANACHPKHGGDSWPDAHGVSLLREARDEFNKLTEPLRTQKRALLSMRLRVWALQTGKVAASLSDRHTPWRPFQPRVRISC